MTELEIAESILQLEQLRDNSEFLKANEIGNALIEKEAIQNDKLSYSKILTILGIVNSYLGEYQKSIHYFEASLKLSEELGIVKGISRNSGNLGVVYDRLSEYPKALEYFHYALEINTKLDNKVGVGINLSNIGNVYISLSNFSKAIEYLDKSLTISKEIDNKNGISTNLLNIGIVNYYLKNYPVALEYYEKSLEIERILDNKHGIARAIGNLGIVYLELEKYDLALNSFEQALSINKEINNKQNIAIDISNLGIVCKALQQFDKAIDFFQQALEINYSINDRHAISVNLFNIGSLFFLLKDYEKASTYLEKSISLAESISNKVTLHECYKLKSEIFEHLGNSNEALILYKKFVSLKDEIQSEENNKKALQLDHQRKIEEDEKARQLKLARFQEQEKLLHNILPVNIADRILQQENFIADHFESVSVLFMDLVGFTPLSSIAPPKQLVYILDTIFQKADEVVERYGLEKIKTIGDGYLAVANVTKTLEEHQKATALAALELLKTMKEFNVSISSDLGNTDWTKDMNEIQVRIGIHTGEVVAGVISKKKMTFDLWGDAVNVASRMESNSSAWKIHISDAFAKAIESQPEFTLIPRGEINIKGKGRMNTFWLEKAK
ncbi:MAG: tetratricopeptide repeat protein [Candidatus Kapabacteria bacterium]|nr:tetratricopeptide repeat protein [Candidatus Kapabacteria bacterium]